MNNTKDYVFIRDKGSKLRLKGDWNSLYSDIEDPWNMKEYPSSLPDILNEFFERDFDYLELGCGLGYHMKKVYDATKTLTVSGIDISDVCVERAKKLYPQLNFFVGDATDKNISTIGNFDCVALVGTLWYVMYDLDQVFNNVSKMLKSNGIFAINQSFLLEQHYGNEVFEGLHGFLELLSRNKFFYVEKIESNRIFHEGKIVLDTAILLKEIIRNVNQEML